MTTPTQIAAHQLANIGLPEKLYKQVDFGESTGWPPRPGCRRSPDFSPARVWARIDLAEWLNTSPHVFGPHRANELTTLAGVGRTLRLAGEGSIVLWALDIIEPHIWIAHPTVALAVTELVGWYPLREWGWDRARCVEFIAQITSRQWMKSACGFCPFAMRTDAGRQAVVDRYRKEPRAGAQALFLEAVARSLNERQTLIEGSSVADLVASAGLVEVQSQFAAMLDECEHAVYEVRRLTRRSSVRAHGRGITARLVRLVARGSREQMDSELRECAGERRVGADGIARQVLRERGEQLPALEHFFVVCPAVVEAKERAGFSSWWREATNDAVLF